MLKAKCEQSVASDCHSVRCLRPFGENMYCWWAPNRPSGYGTVVDSPCVENTVSLDVRVQCLRFSCASARRAQSKRVRTQVNKVGDDEEAFPENQGIMDRQKATGSLLINLDAQRFEENENEDEDEEGAADNDREATSSLGSSSVQSK